MEFNIVLLELKFRNCIYIHYKLVSVIFQNISLSQNFARMNDVLLIIFKVNYSKIIPSNIIMTSQDQYFLKLFIYITYIIDILYLEETIQGY